MVELGDFARVRQRKAREREREREGEGERGKERVVGGPQSVPPFGTLRTHSFVLGSVYVGLELGLCLCTSPHQHERDKSGEGVQQHALVLAKRLGNLEALLHCRCQISHVARCSSAEPTHSSTHFQPRAGSDETRVWALALFHRTRLSLESVIYGRKRSALLFSESIY